MHLQLLLLIRGKPFSTWAVKVSTKTEGAARVARRVTRRDLTVEQTAEDLDRRCEETIFVPALCRPTGASATKAFCDSKAATMVGRVEATDATIKAICAPEAFVQYLVL